MSALIENDYVLVMMLSALSILGLWALVFLIHIAVEDSARRRRQREEDRLRNDGN